MIGNAEEIIKWLFTQDREKVFEVKEHKEKRSLTANAYAWCLIGKIADALRTSKDEVYFEMLKRYGQSEVFSILSTVDVSGAFKYYEKFGEITLFDDLTQEWVYMTNYRVFRGSSEYDSREMAILIDGIISEAKELDIETLPPHEVERLKEMWNG